jgi:hypothetical protein
VLDVAGAVVAAEEGARGQGRGRIVKGRHGSGRVGEAVGVDYAAEGAVFGSGSVERPERL